MPSEKKEAIILSRRDYGESDRLLCIYSLESGKQTVLAKGVRKPLSKLGGFLEQFSHVELVLSGGKGLAIVNESNILDSFKKLRTEYSLVEKATKIAQLVQSFIPEEEANPELFKLLLESLIFLSENLASELVQSYFYLNFLKIHGFAPNLTECENCNRELDVQEIYFGEPFNNFHCRACKSQTDNKISPNKAKLLKLILNENLSFLEKLNGFSPNDLQELENLALAMLSYHFEKDLRL